MSVTSREVERLTVRDLMRSWCPNALRAAGSLGGDDAAKPATGGDQSPAEAWARSGAAGLTVPGGAPPGDVIARTRAAATMVEALASRLGASLRVDGPGLLVERERHCTLKHLPAAGWTLRRGTRMLPTADGWVALNLSRPDDRDLIPALTDGQAAPAVPIAPPVNDAGPVSWQDDLARWAERITSAALTERAVLLGLACGAVPPRRHHQQADVSLVDSLGHPRPAPGTALPSGDRRMRPLRDLTVVDLSLLWAGPLAGALLAQGGAQVLRARDELRSPAVPAQDKAFDRRLHGLKQTVDVDFRQPGAVAALLQEADVVITSMRPEAVHRLGWSPRPEQIWLGITGHGLRGGGASRIGFGDDCAAEAGLVVWQNGSPAFAADAIADPMTGLVATAAVLGLLASGKGGTVDLDLTDVARWAGSLPRAS